jgi:hypothetical protein
MPEAPSPTRRLNVINCPVVDYWLLVTRVRRNMRALVRQAKLPVKWMKGGYDTHFLDVILFLTLDPEEREKARKRFAGMIEKLSEAA